jgi:hypothetical protein
MVESIFDYNPTERELRRFGIKREDGSYEEQIALSKEMISVAEKPDYYCLYILFKSRGDEKRAADHWAKMEQWQRDIFIQDF